MTDCFWTNEVGCYDPACEAPPTNIIYSAGAYRSPSGFVMNTGNFANKFNDLIDSPATTASLVDVKQYEGSFCDCDFKYWIAGSASHDTPSDPPHGAFIAESSLLSYDFDPTDETSALSDMLDYAYSTLGISPSSSPTSADVFIATVQTDVGIVVFPICDCCCF